MTPNERGPLEAATEHQPGLSENRLNLIQSGRNKLVQIVGRAGIAAMSVLAINCGSEEAPTGQQPGIELPVDGNPKPDNPQEHRIPEDFTAPGTPTFENNRVTVGPEVEEVVFEGRVPNPEDTVKIEVKEADETEWREVPYNEGAATFQVTVPAPSNCQIRAVDLADNASDSSDFGVEKDDVAPEAPQLDQSPVMLGIHDTSFTKMVQAPSDAVTLVVYKNGDIVHALDVDGPQMTTTVEFDSEADPTGTYEVKATDEFGNEGPGANFEVSYEAPSIGNLSIDCSDTGGECASYGEIYPITFNAENIISATASVQKLTEFGTEGSISEVTIEGGIGHLEYTTGEVAGNIIEISIEANGPGGNTTESIVITLE